ncbi:small multi-drug export protein [Aureococcus anophagefferens]|nr:small multi-drug export protein [Aureococcus anophagefferens]
MGARARAARARGNDVSPRATDVDHVIGGPEDAFDDMGAPMRINSSPLVCEGFPDDPRAEARPAAAAPTAVAAVAAATLLAPGPASASHLGDVVADKLRLSGFSDAWIIALISAMPVVELRGAIPIGALMGLPIAKVFVLCVIGNMAPILPLLLALRSPLLAAFVGVPFPGTGAWTGAMVAFVLGMPLSEALSAIFAGVLVAGAIMSALVAAGTKGALAVAAVIAGAFAFKALAGGDDAPEETAPAASD